MLIGNVDLPLVIPRFLFLVKKYQRRSCIIQCHVSDGIIVDQAGMGLKSGLACGLLMLLIIFKKGIC